MANPPTFEEFDSPAQRATPRERKGQIDERRSSADATLAEAKAPYAGRQAAASTELTEAQARRANAAAAAEEAKAAGVAADAERAKTTAAQDTSTRAYDLTRYIGMIQRARDIISGGAATGLTAQITGALYGSPAKDLKGALEAIASPVVLEAMAEARKGSKAGATGFGALSEKELAILKSKYGSLREDQSDEALLATLADIERSYRRLMAYNAGYDPDKPEGALLVGLPLPEGSEAAPPPQGEIGPEGGQWIEDPELRGVDAGVKSMIKAGRSADQIRSWLDQYQPGLGQKITGLEGQIRYFKQTGREPQADPNFGRAYVPGEETFMSSMADNPVGAGVVAASDQLFSGLTAEMGAGELEGQDYERNAAVMRGLREKYPFASLVGDVAGIAGSMIGGVAAAGKAGLRLPGLLEGTIQEGLYGFGSAEPGQRLGGTLSSVVAAPLTNVGGKFAGDLFGNLLRGADVDARVLSEKYGINLTPGQMAADVRPERSVAGLPIVGPQVTARRNETLDQFNRAAFDDALKPIGANTPNVGQKGIAEAQNAVSEAYTSALGGRTFQFDGDFLRVVQGKPYAELAAMKGELGPKAAGEIDRILAEINNGGAVDGLAWQQARRQLVDLQASKEIKDDIAGNAVASNLGDIIDGFDDLVLRQAPDAFEGYMAANAAHRNVKILERAVDYAPNGDVFGPGNLRNATRIGTQKFGGSAASARGDRPFNELTMAALGKVPDKVDDASAVGRFGAPAVGAVGLGSYAGVNTLAQPNEGEARDDIGTVPAWMLAAAAGAGLTSLPYSKRGVSLMNSAMMGGRSNQQQIAGDILQKYLPAAGRGVVRMGDTEPGAPMPLKYNYDQMGSPELRAAVEAAAQTAQPLAPAERSALGLPENGYADVDAAGNAIGGEAAGAMLIDGRAVDRDPSTGEMIFLDTGEPVPGFADGGPVMRSSAYDAMTRAAPSKAKAPVMRSSAYDDIGRAAQGKAPARRRPSGQKPSRTAPQTQAPTFGDRARSVAKGATFAFNDEIEAGLRAAAQMDFSEYERAVAQIRAQQAAYEEANPMESLAYEMGGSMLPAFIPGAQGATGARLAMLASKYPRAARLAPVLAESAAYGIGAADSMRDIPRSVVEEGLPSLAMYGAGTFAVPRARRAFQALRGR